MRFQGNTVTLLKSGKPAAVLIPVELFERLMAGRQDVGAAVRRIQTNVTQPLSDEEAMSLVAMSLVAMSLVAMSLVAMSLVAMSLVIEAQEAENKA